MLKTFKIWSLLGIISFLLFIICIFLPYRPVDIHINNSFFVNTVKFILILLAVLFLCLFLLYLFIVGLSKWEMKKFHIIGTISLSLIIIATIHNASKAYSPGFSDWEFFEVNNIVLVITIVFLILLQFFFIFYLAAKATKNWHK